MAVQGLELNSGWTARNAPQGKTEPYDVMQSEVAVRSRATNATVLHNQGDAGG
jgi:hypothetical protein